MVAPTTEGSIKHDDDDGDQINATVLFTGLMKLSCIFEINESLTRSLIDEVMNDKHKCFDDQFFGLEDWITKHSDANLSPQEIYSVIKYVELYESLPADDKKPSIEGGSLEKAGVDTTACPLMCPYRSDLAVWAATIHRKEVDKIYGDMDVDTTMHDTMRMDSLECTEDDEGDGSTFTRLRNRTASDVSDV